MFTGTPRSIKRRVQFRIAHHHLKGVQPRGEIEGAQVHTLPPRPTERCMFARDGPLNAATRYTRSRMNLVFSKNACLTFERVGFVTPVRKAVCRGRQWGRGAG